MAFLLLCNPIISRSHPSPTAIQDNLAAAVTYFHNHIHQMNYAFYGEKHYPIGSGVTEAACKLSLSNACAVLG